MMDLNDGTRTQTGGRRLHVTDYQGAQWGLAVMCTDMTSYTRAREGYFRDLTGFPELSEATVHNTLSILRRYAGNPAERADIDALHARFHEIFGDGDQMTTETRVIGRVWHPARNQSATLEQVIRTGIYTCGGISIDQRVARSWDDDYANGRGAARLEREAYYAAQEARNHA